MKSKIQKHGTVVQIKSDHLAHPCCIGVIISYTKKEREHCEFYTVALLIPDTLHQNTPHVYMHAVSPDGFTVLKGRAVHGVPGILEKKLFS